MHRDSSQVATTTHMDIDLPQKTPRGVCVVTPDEPGDIFLAHEILKMVEGLFASTVPLSIAVYSDCEDPRMDFEIPFISPEFIVFISRSMNFGPLFSWIRDEWGANAGCVIARAGINTSSIPQVADALQSRRWTAFAHGREVQELTSRFWKSVMCRIVEEAPKYVTPPEFLAV